MRITGTLNCELQMHGCTNTDLEMRPDLYEHDVYDNKDAPDILCCDHCHKEYCDDI